MDEHDLRRFSYEKVVADIIHHLRCLNKNERDQLPPDLRQLVNEMRWRHCHLGCGVPVHPKEGKWVELYPGHWELSVGWHLLNQYLSVKQTDTGATYRLWETYSNEDDFVVEGLADSVERAKSMVEELAASRPGRQAYPACS